MPRAGRDFEEAVYRFASTLDPSAEVIFDHMVPDRDTGEPRQCDVWINATFANHWPMSILVSCKDKGRNLHVGDIGAFLDEKRSTGATMGVIYSPKGFSENALKKAKANSIACCRLYRDEPGDIPPSIYLEQYTCNPQVQLVLFSNTNLSGVTTWNDLFDVEVEAPENRQTLLDLVETAYKQSESAVVEQAGQDASFPEDWTRDLGIELDNGEILLLRILGRWNCFRAQMKASLLSGSYSFDNDSFVGTVTGPSIDTYSSHPGKGWERVTDSDLRLPANSMVFILSQGNLKERLRSESGPKSIFPNR